MPGGVWGGEGEVRGTPYSGYKGEYSRGEFIIEDREEIGEDRSS